VDGTVSARRFQRIFYSVIAGLLPVCYRESAAGLFPEFLF
jgi:hypothetical protein